MQTKCPHCHTIFEATDEQLAQAEQQVRCGHCLAIFTAEACEPSDQANNNEDMIISSGDVADLFDNENKEETDVLPDVIPPELRAETRNPGRNYGLLGTLLMTLAIVSMIAAGILQFAFYNRYSLVQHNELRPWLGLMCQYAKCDLPAPKNTALIGLSSKNIYTHPNKQGALMVSATIVNHASFEQDFPVMELRFENIRGEVIAARRFLPEEYLGIPEDQVTRMDSSNPVSFNIEIIDPGKDMVSYEFDFL